MKPKCSIKDQRLIPNWFILWLFRRTEKLKYTLNHATILDHFADRKEVGLIAFQKKNLNVSNHFNFKSAGDFRLRYMNLYAWLFSNSFHLKKDTNRIRRCALHSAPSRQKLEFEVQLSLTCQSYLETGLKFLWARGKIYTYPKCHLIAVKNHQLETKCSPPSYSGRDGSRYIEVPL